MGDILIVVAKVGHNVVMAAIKLFGAILNGS